MHNCMWMWKHFALSQILQDSAVNISMDNIFVGWDTCIMGEPILGHLRLRS